MADTQDSIPADIRTELHALRDATRQRFNVLYGTLGVMAALTIATLSIMVNMSYQLGRIAGELTVLIAHVTLR